MLKESSMPIIRIVSIVGVLVAAILGRVGANSLQAGVTSSFARGIIIEEVVCRDSQHSYSLYLPSGYNPERKWPSLFILEPAARSILPLERFKEAAETYGYILVCSRQFQDGPYEENNRAMLAMWQDIQQRFALDLSRRYAAGFSGGARGASRLHVMKQKSLAGIIACGAGLDLRLKAADLLPAFYIATVGLDDFNYKEMMKLDEALEQAGVEHIVLVLEDYHRWPGVPVCTRMVEWLELQAMKKGSRPMDTALVDTLYQKELDIARGLESAGKLYQAARGYEACKTLFTRLREVSAAETGKKRVTANNELKDEIRRNREEWEYIAIFAGTFQKIEASAVTYSSLRQTKKEMRIPYLRKIVDKSKNGYEVSWAKRLLTELILKLSRAGSHYLDKGDFQRSVLYFRLVIEASRRNEEVYFELARAYSLWGKKKEALKSLRTAVEKGYKDLSALEDDKALEPLREEKEYKELIRLLQR
jgi:predicted esterase